MNKADTPDTSEVTPAVDNPATKVKLVDYFALEPEELASDPEKVAAIVAYQREKRRVFFEEQKGKARVKKEKPINDVLDKKVK